MRALAAPGAHHGERPSRKPECDGGAAEGRQRCRDTSHARRHASMPASAFQRRPDLPDNLLLVVAGPHPRDLLFAPFGRSAYYRQSTAFSCVQVRFGAGFFVLFWLFFGVTFFAGAAGAGDVVRLPVGRPAFGIAPSAPYRRR